jgi:hypothetical protein
MQGGLVFQNEIFNGLRGLSWAATVCDIWDLEQGIDILLSGKAGRRLKYQIALQATRRCGNPEKFDRWLKSRSRYSRDSQVYFESEIAVAAEALPLLDAALASLVNRGPGASGIFALKITSEGNTEWSVPKKYLQRLWDQYDADWSNPNRKTGEIVAVTDIGLIAASEGTMYYGYLGDAVDHPLVQRLRRGTAMKGDRITFLPTGMRNGGPRELIRSMRLADE